jgi:hypothetical protein
MIKHKIFLYHIYYNKLVLFILNQLFQYIFFGVCKTKGKQNHQLNFVIEENELSKDIFKDANTTLNIVYFSL